MKKIIFILLVAVSFYNSAYAVNKNQKNKVIEGTIFSYECGDYCYLTITDKNGKKHDALCADGNICDKLSNNQDANYGGLKDKKVKVTVVKEKINGGGEIVAMDSFVKIKLIR